MGGGEGWGGDGTPQLSLVQPELGNKDGSPEPHQIQNAEMRWR